MAAIDTIASYQGTVGSTFAAGTMASGDSGTVRNFPQGGKCHLAAAFSDHVTSVQGWRVRSPLLHDNVQGIRFYPGETPAQLYVPRGVHQLVQPQDTLTFELSTAAATGKALAALSLYYENMPGATARLFAPGDVYPLVDNIKPLVVNIGSGANTAGAWYDAVLTATESLLHANTDYAVLGYLVDVGVAAVAVKGIDTGNLRVAGPGVKSSDLTAEWFVRLSEQSGLPCIPVINSANAGATYVSIVSSAATAAAMNVQLILAELSRNLGQ